MVQYPRCLLQLVAEVPAPEKSRVAGRYLWISTGNILRFMEAVPVPPDSLSPEQRSLRSRMAAHALHARVTDPAAHTAPARMAFLDRFAQEADPDGVLAPAERARRAEHLRKAYFTKLAYASSRVRSQRRNSD